MGVGVLAAAALGAFAFLYTTRSGSHRAQYVYADGVAAAEQQKHGIACTAEAANTQLQYWVCTEWTTLQPGQAIRPAADPGGPCGIRHVDQTAGAWVCDNVDAPDPDSLPHVRPPVREVSS